MNLYSFHPSSNRDTRWRLFDSPRHWSLSRELKENASLLFEQQMWCFGQDIKRDPNLLLSYGFSRERPPEGGSTMYRSDGIFLWGFGIIATAPGLGSISIKRSGFSPTWATDEVSVKSLWEPERFPSFSSPISQRDHWRAALLLERTFAWLAEYEAWISKECGSYYRRSLLQTAPEKRAVPGESMERTWKEILKRYSS